MTTINGTVGRVDYIRVICRAPVALIQQWEIRMLNCLPDEIKNDASEMRKHGKLVAIYDGSLRRSTKCIEFWGRVASQFFAALPDSEYKNITRIDWRHEVPDPALDNVDMYKEIKRHKTNARRTLHMMDSPVRTKEDGRDAGGVGVIVGAKGSKRRFTLYKRGKERWALECQFGDKKPAELLAVAQASIERNDGQGDLYVQYLKACQQAYYDCVFDFTGHSYGEFAHLEMWNQQDNLFTSQEEILAQADELWNRMDPEAQSAFIAANVGTAGRYGVPVPMPVEEPTEAERNWERHAAELAANEWSWLDRSAEEYDEYSQGNW